jgi:hypothetical protein
MSDLSPYIPAAGAFGQIAEGGANAHDNCIPDAFAYLAKCYGLTYVPPEVWVLDEYGTPAPGATTIQAAVQEATHIYGMAFPGATVGYPDLAAVGLALDSGRPSIILANVDCASVRYSPSGRCGHAGIVVGHIGVTWLVWNPWYGSLDPVSDSFMYAAVYYQAVLDRSITGGFHLDQDVNNALRKIGLTTAAAAGNASLKDADLNQAWPVIAPDFSNLGDVSASYIKSHKLPTAPTAGGVAAHEHPLTGSTGANS